MESGLLMIHPLRAETSEKSSSQMLLQHVLNFEAVV